jgi:hypothetical protein
MCLLRARFQVSLRCMRDLESLYLESGAVPVPVSSLRLEAVDKLPRAAPSPTRASTLRLSLDVRTRAA